jgi:hypothetical protein
VTNTFLQYSAFFYFVGWYVIAYQTFSILRWFYFWAYYEKPVSFLQIWLYMEDKFEQMQKVADEENTETRRKMVDSLLNSEARTKDGLKEELKKFKKDETK